MFVDFHDRTKSVQSDDIDMLQRLLEVAAENEAISDVAELSINFVADNEIQELNRNYRQQDEPTDVISFAMQETIEEETPVVGEDIPLVLGDIVISVDRAKEQAAEYNHSLQREIGFLIVHGFLHLLGYDHMEKDEETTMFQRQEEILDAFGLRR